MKKQVLMGLIIASCLNTHGQQYLSSASYREKNKMDDNIGLIASLGLNATHRFVVADGYTRSAKGSLSIMPTLGFYLQKGISQDISVRLSVSFGVNNYAYKYAQPFDSLQPGNFPTTSSEFDSYTRIKKSNTFVLPQLDIGYILKPIKEMYLIEVRAGAGLHTYLSQNGHDTATISDIKRVAGLKGNSIRYFETEKSYYGGPRNYGTFVSTLYLGLRWQKTFSNLLNHSAIGVQAILPLNLDNAGYSEINYTATGNGNYLLGTDKVKMGLLSFGIRYTYSIL